MHGLHEHRSIAWAQIQWATGDEGVKPFQINVHGFAMHAKSGQLTRLIHIIEAYDSFYVLEVVQSVDTQIGVVAEFA